MSRLRQWEIADIQLRNHVEHMLWCGIDADLMLLAELVFGQKGA